MFINNCTLLWQTVCREKVFSSACLVELLVLQNVLPVHPWLSIFPILAEKCVFGQSWASVLMFVLIDCHQAADAGVQDGGAEIRILIEDRWEIKEFSDFTFVPEHGILLSVCFIIL